ncbi:MAG: biotin--[acetyl-CoA-carboxylase] ligase, partial [Thermomicrobiales bacterium]
MSRTGNQQPPRWVVQHYQTLDSTMDRAGHFARSGAAEGIVVVSEEQTAGRGRAGRTWHSPPGAALYATLLLRPPVPPERLTTLPLLAGVAVAEAIEELTGAPAQLKWPNDVWLGNDSGRQKVAGILLTSAISGAGVSHVLCGIGVNLTTPPEALPPGGTSILAATGVATTPEAMLRALLPAFARQYARFLQYGGQPPLDTWRARAALLGEPVTIDEAGATRAGRFAGIDPD